MECAETYTSLCYTYDGSLEGLLSAIFASYERRQRPLDVYPEGKEVLRLGQLATFIPTNIEHAERVRAGIIREHGRACFRRVLKGSLSADPSASTIVYEYVRLAMDGPRESFYDISHPKVDALRKLVISVGNECEHIRQFARFKHYESAQGSLWIAKVHARDNVVPLVMGHFAERFSIQPFILFDANHSIAGAWDGKGITFASVDERTMDAIDMRLASEEVECQMAWREFFTRLSVKERYNPELQQRLMPKRFWKDLVEMDESEAGLIVQGCL